MRLEENPPRAVWPLLCTRPKLDTASLQLVVEKILLKVKEYGDQALFDYAKTFDGAVLSNLAVGREELASANELVTEDLKQAIQLARGNIEKFHRAQLGDPIEVETSPGVCCTRKSLPLSSVGLYIPGGTAPLFSTVLMLGIPAMIAGCKEVVLCTPPSKNGTIHPAILYTAELLGIKKIYRIGGAQAIAAMAYGTESVPRVNKIFGPGNQYVNRAKQLVQAEGVAIDLPAGPSEVAVVADKTSNPAFVAADLLSQAEHGADSQVILVSTSKDLVDSVKKELSRQLEDLPRAEIAEQALNSSLAVIFQSIDLCLDFVNFYAPEHLILADSNSEQTSALVENAGSVFIGTWTPESVGDYASGTNHTLPTAGSAVAWSGVSLDSFFKKITFQKLSPKGLLTIGPSVEVMAKAEQLHAHARAVSLRLAELEVEKDDSDES